MAFSSSTTDAITPDALAAMLLRFSETVYDASSGDSANSHILQNALSLLGRDFAFELLPNDRGSLCSTYPELLPYPVFPTVSSEEVYQIISQVRHARCRNRFVVPVMSFRGKYLCRSATLATGKEMLLRNSLNYIRQRFAQTVDNSVTSMVDDVRSDDVKLLKLLRVSHIVDLMLETHVYRYGVKTASSEKVDNKMRYQQVKILSLPYFGVEHFAAWTGADYSNAQNLYFDWTSAEITSSLKLPPEFCRDNLPSVYKSLDTVSLTQRYLKLVLQLLINSIGSSGVLVHCISGWDRTPLFVALVRISLWADGVLHLSLSPVEMAYLVIAYDWFLFGHNLVGRRQYRQEIFRFSFSMLEFIDGDEYSYFSLCDNSESQLGKADRKARLRELQKVFFDAEAVADNLAATRGTTFVQLELPPDP